MLRHETNYSTAKSSKHVKQAGKMCARGLALISTSGNIQTAESC